MSSLYTSSLRRSAVAVGVLGATLVLGSVAPAFAQSLADLARREEERKKAVKADPKVYTDKDVGSIRASTPPSVVSSSPAVDAGTSSGSAATAQPGAPAAAEPPPADAAAVKDQAYWSDRMKKLRDQVARDQTFAEALQTRINVLASDFVNRDDPAQRSGIEAERQKAVAELQRLQEAIAEGQKAIAQLEDEARRSNVPPGWLR
jgi:hypothetical protein